MILHYNNYILVSIFSETLSKSKYLIIILIRFILVIFCCCVNTIICHIKSRHPPLSLWKSFFEHKSHWLKIQSVAGWPPLESRLEQFVSLPVKLLMVNYIAVLMVTTSTNEDQFHSFHIALFWSSSSKPMHLLLCSGKAPCDYVGLLLTLQVIS